MGKREIPSSVLETVARRFHEITRGGALNPNGAAYLKAREAFDKADTLLRDSVLNAEEIASFLKDNGYDGDGDYEGWLQMYRESLSAAFGIDFPKVKPPLPAVSAEKAEKGADHA